MIPARTGFPVRARGSDGYGLPFCPCVAPGSPITWNATVNMSNWAMILDDGQVTASTGGGGDANQGATQGQNGSP